MVLALIFLGYSKELAAMPNGGWLRRTPRTKTTSEAHHITPKTEH